MGAHLLGTTPLTDDEIQQFRKQLQEIGPKWSQLAEQFNKSATLLKTFYFHYKKKYGFDQAVNEYYKVHANEDRRPVTDGDESDVSVTSSDDNGPDMIRKEADVKKTENVKMEVETTPCAPMNLQAPPAKELTSIKPEPISQNTSDERLMPPLGQPPPLLSSQQIQNLSTGIPRDGNPMISVMMRTKKHSEDYDSSATETADEENESSPANRQSPKAPSVFTGKPLLPATSISMVPSLTPQQNGPPANVRDAMLDYIERSLKSNTLPPKSSQVPPLKPNPPPGLQQVSAPVDSNPDITFVGSYRHDGANKIQIQPQRRSNSENLATLSIVNQGNLQNQQIIAGHPLNISSIAATITPVPPPQSNQQRPSSNPHAQDKDIRKIFPDSRGMMTQQISSQPEPEPQTLDLSIKKPQQLQQQPQERQFQSFAKAVPPPPTVGSVYRGDPSLQAQPNIPNQSNFLAFHPDMNSRHPSKSPSTYISPSLSPGQRVLTMNPHMQQQQQQQQVGKGGKGTPKLSPKVHQQQSGNVQQLNGPKGSITLGTPLTDNRGQPIMIQGSSSSQSPRYDLMRQTPPANDNKFGSITAGTPIHMGKVHDYMKNSRHSPASNQPPNVSVAGTGSPHPSQQFTSPYRPSQHTNELNTQALIFSDYLTSQQMPGHQQARGGNNLTNTINIISGPPPRSEKESPSPRNIAHSTSPAMYYADKERERPGSGQTRTEYLSRSSPADHQNK